MLSILLELPTNIHIAIANDLMNNKNDNDDSNNNKEKEKDHLNNCIQQYGGGEYIIHI